MKLKKLENKLKNQFMNDAEELTAIMQDQFGDGKDFDVINYNLTLTFTVNGEERYIEMKTPFNVDDNEE
jgi:hypothetical protein